MNLQRKKISFAVMVIMLGTIPLNLSAETQTTDEVINATIHGADIEFNNLDAGAHDWEICTGPSSCSALSGALPTTNGFKITNQGVNSIGIESGSGSTTVPLIYLDSNERVGINTDTPGEDFEVRSTTPAIRLQDLSVGAGQADIQMNTNTFSIENNTGNDAIVMETNGGANQNNQLYLDSSGNVGIGVSNPGVSLMVGNGGDIVLDATATTNDWAIAAGGDGLKFRQGNGSAAIGGTTAFHLENGSASNSLVIDSTSNIGVGTASPTSTLHVQKVGATMAVQDTNATAGVRQLLKLTNKGAVGFQMRDTTDTAPWDFRTGSGGSFVVANLGTAGPEIFISKSGLVKMGPNVQNFTLSAAGNLTIPNGTATAIAHISSSSREVKKDFSEVNPADVMSKIQKLEMSEWSYKGEIHEEASGRHVGPMAEDFYSLFGLGPDDKHVAATDMASIALIAAKELQQKATQANIEIASFKEKNAALLKRLEAQAKRLESLEKLVTNLASSEHVITQGEKLAINK